MTDSLRDQLLGLGFKPPSKPVVKPAPSRPAPSRPAPTRASADKPARSGGKPVGQRPDQRKSHPQRSPHASRDTRKREEIDLAKAYAIRAQKEKDERIEAERQRQEQARLRREAKARLATLMEGRALNEANADIARHFSYGGKIKRVYVTAAQLKQLNAGALGVIQLDGRYALVTAALLAEAEAVFPAAVALKVDPSAAQGDDPYADPQYQVPDDLVW